MDLEDGILTNTSGGYRVHEFKMVGEEEDGTPILRAVDWELKEASFVDIPADPTVGVGRSDLEEESDARALDTNGGSPTTEPKEAIEMPEEKSAAPAAVDAEAIRAEFAAEQAKRAEGIRGAFALYGEKYAGLEAAILADPTVTVESAQRRLLDAVAKESAAPVPTNDVRVEAGDDKADKFRAGFLQATMSRAGMEKNADLSGSEFRGMSFADAARHFLAINGANINGLSRMDIIGRALTFHTTSDFTDVLFDAANKSVLKGWDEHEETYPAISSEMSVSDFKQNHMIGLSGFSDLDEVLESGEYNLGTMSDRRELIQLATYGKRFRLTRKALINDDLSMFSRVAVAMGRAARRKIGDLVYAVLTSNPLMNEDGVALFAAGHSNLAAAGAAPSTTTFGTARTAMALQADPTSAAALNIRPQNVIAPIALEDVILDLLNSTEGTDQAAGSVNNALIRRMNLSLVTDARLDSDSTTAYYFEANPSVYDTISLAFLEGQSSPFMDEQDEWDVDGKTWKVRIDAAAAPGDFRTFYKNPGA